LSRRRNLFIIEGSLQQGRDDKLLYFNTNIISILTNAALLINQFCAIFWARIQANQRGCDRNAYVDLASIDYPFRARRWRVAMEGLTQEAFPNLAQSRGAVDGSRVLLSPGQLDRECMVLQHSPDVERGKRPVAPAHNDNTPLRGYRHTHRHATAKNHDLLSARTTAPKLTPPTHVCVGFFYAL